MMTAPLSALLVSLEPTGRPRSGELLQLVAGPVLPCLGVCSGPGWGLAKVTGQPPAPASKAHIKADGYFITKWSLPSVAWRGEAAQHVDTRSSRGQGWVELSRAGLGSQWGNQFRRPDFALCELRSQNTGLSVLEKVLCRMPDKRNDSTLPQPQSRAPPPLKKKNASANNMIWLCKNVGSGNDFRVKSTIRPMVLLS